jgi:hypothetical protein
MNDCAICSNPAAATFEQRVEHGCTIGDEANYCAWCGKAWPWSAKDSPRPIASWCPGCADKHRAANPTADWFVGFVPIEDAFPGGPHDGVWENSGLELRDHT